MKDILAERPAHFGPLFGYCHHQVQKLMNRLLRQYDVSPMQCRTLTFLHDAEGEVNQKALEKHLMVKPSTVNGIVDRLVEKGMLTRTPGEKDGRCRILRLTEAGQQFYDDFESITRQIEDLIHRGMDPQETETLRRLLLRAADNLTSEEDNA